MILTGNEIYKEVKNGNVVIEPFSAENLDPNSYAFHIGNEIIEYDSDRQRILDAKKDSGRGLYLKTRKVLSCLYI